MVEFAIRDQHMEFPRGYTQKEVADARKIGEELAQSFDFVKACMLTRTTKDAELHVYIDDVGSALDTTRIEAYATKAQSLIHTINKHIVLKPMKISGHWELYRMHDPLYMNALRYGIVVYDEGFIAPVKHLLAKGRIRPSKESQRVYFMQMQQTLKRAEGHILQAVIDLSWACLDAGHAAIMSTGRIAPRPKEMADVLDEVFVEKGLLEAKYPKILRKLYSLHKSIEHRQTLHMSGRDWNTWYKEAEQFVRRMKRLL